MTINDQQPSPPQKQIYAEGRGKYSIVDGNKIFEFYFPIQGTLAQNLEVVSYLKDEILKAIEDQKKKEEEKKVNESDAK